MSVDASDDSFRSVFEPHRRPLLLHCYRMVGSLQDAEELAQETLLRAWQRRDELRASQALRAWLYQIATNACLDQLAKLRRRRALPHLLGTPPSTEVRFGTALEQTLWLEPVPDALLDAEDDAAGRPEQRATRRESIGLAFITALQSLSPKQRAALLLVDVLSWTPQETATLLQTSVFSVNSLLQRARKSVADRAEDATPQPVASVDMALLRRFIQAWESGDSQAFAALLAEDALLSMPPQPEWYAGRDSVARFFATVWSALPGERRLVAVAANGLPALALYRRPAPDAPFEPSAITLLVLRDERVAELIRFAFPRLFPLFGLPAQPV
jgi:RNA polymerase sigma-70 factor (ECF subfamily)